MEIVCRKMQLMLIRTLQIIINCYSMAMMKMKIAKQSTDWKNSRFGSERKWISMQIFTALGTIIIIIIIADYRAFCMQASIELEIFDGAYHLHNILLSPPLTVYSFVSLQSFFFLFSLQLEEPSNPTCSWTKFFVWIFLMTLYYFSPLAIDFMHSSWIIWVTNSVTTRLRTLFFSWNMPVRLHLMKAFLSNYCGLYGPDKEEKRKTKLPQQ